MMRLLDALPEHEHDDASRVLGACPVVALPQGAQRAGARLPAAALLVVEEGLAAVSRRRNDSARRMVVTLAGPGAILPPLGEDERLDALEDSWLTAITPAALAALLLDPAVAETLVVGLTKELRASRESLGQIASVKHVERVRDKLLQLARAHGRVVPGGVRLDLPLTHELIGEMIGSSRETVTWAFAQLAREGFVRREGRAYRLRISPEELAS
jgi:CRP-like cAMP-binding protein